ncbi:MAG TPA: glycosyltransferase family 4 protein [Kineosporiaceae bacterium]
MSATPSIGGLRVLHLSDLYPPVLGGLERVVQDLSSGLARRGAEAAVATLIRGATPTPGVQIFTLDSLSAAIPGLHADASRPFHPTAPDLRVAAGLEHVVREFNPDVVHAHSWLANSWLVLARRHPRVRTVLYAHDYGLFCSRKTNQHDGTGEACGRPALVRCVRCATDQYGRAKSTVLSSGLRVMARSYRRADAVVAVSAAVSSTLASTLGLPTPQVIPPALDLADFSARDPQRPDFLPDGPFVLYAGQLSAHKGVDVLLEAVRGLPGVSLVMLGIPKTGWQVPDDPHVVVRLGVPHEIVMACWRYATVGVVPSLWADPMPLVALEAMSAGCPVVASDVGGLRDSVADGETGFKVPPGDPAALREGLRRVLAEDRLRSIMTVNARSRYVRFGFDAVLDQWSTLYRRLPRSRSEVARWE